MQIRSCTWLFKRTHLIYIITYHTQTYLLVLGSTPSALLLLWPYLLVVYSPATPYRHNTRVHDCSFYELDSDLNIIYLSSFQLWMYVSIIKGALKIWSILGPTLDKWNLKIPGKDRPVDYFKSYLGDSKVQPVKRTTESCSPFDAQGLRSPLPIQRSNGPDPCLCCFTRSL